MILKNVRLAYPVIFKPKQYLNRGDYKFSALICFEKNHPQLPDLKKELVKLAKETNHLNHTDKSIYPIMNGAVEKPKNPAFENLLYISAKANENRPPKVIDERKNQLTEQDGKPTDGDYVNVSVRFYPQDRKWGSAIRASIGIIQFVRAGSPIGFMEEDISEFEEIEVDTSQEISNEDEKHICYEGNYSGKEAYDDDVPF